MTSINKEIINLIILLSESSLMKSPTYEPCILLLVCISA